MQTKVCSICKEVKDISLFYSDKRASDKLQSSCKICHLKNQKALKKKYPQKVKDNYLRVIEKKRNIKIELVELLGGKCCKCGYDKSTYALDFHHKNPEEKDYSISLKMNKGVNIDILKEEAKKCILLCANCHRELHGEENAT